MKATRDIARDERGGVVMLFAMMVMILIGSAALAVDAGRLYVTETELQHTASAAALAAVQDLPNAHKARAAAHVYAQRNMPVAEHGDVLGMADIVVGEWDPDARSFTPGGAKPNAMHVVTRRAQANGNPATTSFAYPRLRQIHRERVEIGARAGDPCNKILISG